MSFYKNRFSEGIFSVGMSENCLLDSENGFLDSENGFVDLDNWFLESGRLKYTHMTVPASCAS